LYLLQDTLLVPSHSAAQEVNSGDHQLDEGEAVDGVSVPVVLTLIAEVRGRGSEVEGGDDELVWDCQ